MAEPSIPVPLTEPTEETAPPGLLRTIVPPLIAFAIMGVLLYPHADEVWDSAQLVSVKAAVALVLLHLAALVLRAEAWGMCLDGAGARVERRTLHATSAFRFLADTVVPTYVGAWVRVVLLRRLQGRRAPTVGQMITADGVILVVEAVITVGLLSLAVATTSVTWWQAALFALAVALVCAVLVVLRRRFHHRPFARAFDVLRGGERRALLTLVLVVVLLIQPVRFWLALDAVGLDPAAAEALAAFLLTSVFGILPIGPGPSSVGASATVFGSAGLAQAGAAGLILAAAATAAAALYCVYAGPTLLRLRRSRHAEAAATGPAPPSASRAAPSTPSGSGR